MRTIKELAKEYNAKMHKVISREIFSLVVLAFSEIFCFSLVFYFSTIFASSTSIFFSMLPIILLFCAFSVSFMLHYGFFVIMCRLTRSERVTVGYLFVGFKEKRLRSAIVFFLFLMAIVIGLSSIPVFSTLDMSNVDAIKNLFQDEKKLKLLSLEITSITLVSFCVLFIRFSFVWPMIYTEKNISGWNAVKNSWKLFRGKTCKFLGFLFYISWKYILFFIVVELCNYYISLTPKGASSFFGYILGFTSFVTLIYLLARLCLAIPVFFDDVCNFSANKKDDSVTLLNETNENIKDGNLK